MREVVWRPLACSLERLDMIYSVHAIVCVLFLIVALKGANSHSYTLHDGLNTDFCVCVCEDNICFGAVQQHLSVLHLLVGLF